MPTLPEMLDHPLLDEPLRLPDHGGENEAQQYKLKRMIAGTSTSSGRIKLCNAGPLVQKKSSHFRKSASHQSTLSERRDTWRSRGRF